MQSSNIVKRALYYFPVRFMLCAVVISYFLIKFDTILQITEKKILAGMLQFFHFPAYYLTGHLYVGHFNAPTQLDVPIDTQLLFFIFFLSLALVVRGSLSTRARILFHGVLCALTYLVAEFLIIILFTKLGFSSPVPYIQAGIISCGIVGALFIESLLFNVITLPKPTKSQTIIQRSYIDEYIFLVILLFSAGAITYVSLNLAQVTSDSPAASYVALNISNILAFKYYIAYFIYEAKTPQWIRRTRHPALKNDSHMSASFLLPAFNEEKGIAKCIGSIDIAAANYSGKT
ncbi:MAG TPA: hypothetical protein VFG24_02295, partial [Nitrosopumilaceae archaeon]|nr:hypothetical protein [Nitrosopumilaceae archaeon]